MQKSISTKKTATKTKKPAPATRPASEQPPKATEDALIELAGGYSESDDIAIATLRGVSNALRTVKLALLGDDGTDHSAAIDCTIGDLYRRCEAAADLAEDRKKLATVGASK